MKLKFDANLEFQMDALRSVLDLFEGLPPKQSDFEISITSSVGPMELEQTELGIGNRLLIDSGQVLKNLQ